MSANSTVHLTELRRKPLQRTCHYCQDVLPIDYTDDWCVRCLQWYHSEQDSNFRLTTLELQKALHDLRREKDSALQSQHERFQAAALRYTDMTRRELDDERMDMHVNYDRLRLEYDSANVTYKRKLQESDTMTDEVRITSEAIGPGTMRIRTIRRT